MLHVIHDLAINKRALFYYLLNLVRLAIGIRTLIRRFVLLWLFGKKWLICKKVSKAKNEIEASSMGVETRRGYNSQMRPIVTKSQESKTIARSLALFP